MSRPTQRAVRRPLPPMLTGAARRTQSGLEPWLPSSGDPFNARRAAHLLRRAVFLPAWSDVRTAVAQGLDATIDALFDTPPDPLSPGAWAEDIVDRPVTQEEKNAYDARNMTLCDALRGWWANVMATSGPTIQERMVFFWSGHITSESREVRVPQLLYTQNQLFRAYALGNFRSLMKLVNHDAAMLRYLGGDINTGGNPNENYARELMELYTMGEGHYTEQDIKEAARCLTGWRLDEFTSLEPVFNPMYHDTGNKTFMGRTVVGRSSLDGRFEGDEIVDIIFEREEVALFLCRKLYLAFVYNNPAAVDGDIVRGLADVFRANNYEIRPVIETLLRSAHFFDDVNVGAMIKNPAVYEAGMVRQFGANPGGTQLQKDMTSLEQELINPPTVQGWEDYRTWISTTTYPLRKNYALRFVTGQMPGGGTQLPMDVVAWAKEIDGHTDADTLIDNILTLLLPRPVSTTRRELYLNAMLGNAPVYEWNIDAPAAAVNLRAMLTRVTEAPDFQQH